MFRVKGYIKILKGLWCLKKENLNRVQIVTFSALQVMLFLMSSFHYICLVVFFLSLYLFKMPLFFKFDYRVGMTWQPVPVINA